MSMTTAIMDGFSTLRLNPGPALEDFQSEQARRDRKVQIEQAQRDRLLQVQWAKMLSLASVARQGSR